MSSMTFGDLLVVVSTLTTLTMRRVLFCDEKCAMIFVSIITAPNRNIPEYVVAETKS